MSDSTDSPLTGKVTSTTDNRFTFDVLRQNVPVLFDHRIEQDRLINVIRRERIDYWLRDQLDDPTASHDTGAPAAVTVRGGST